MKKRISTLVAATIFLAGTAHGAERAFFCEYKSGYGGWTPEAALFVFDEDKGTAEAYDFWIKTMHSKPIAVDMSRASTQRIQFNWRLNKIPSKFRGGETQLVDVNYRATINLKTKQGTVRVTPTVDVLNNTKASGKCREVQP